MSETILITGSTRGIGLAVTLACLSRGFKVVGLGRDHKRLESVDFGCYVPIQVDFSKISHLEDCYKEVWASNPEISAVICCGGYGQFCELEQFSLKAMQRMMDVNFLSQALLIKMALPALKKRGKTKIILIGSECALSGQKKGSLYSASKFALRGFAQSLRHECRENEVAVTLINPGFVRTPFFDELSFKPGPEVMHAIDVEQVAELIMMTLQLDNNCVLEEINCQPMKKVIVKK